MKESSFYYAYILQSETAPNRYYTGFTKNLQNRLKHHKLTKYKQETIL
ncbi:MAG: GIY-YIG nuclease family protein [Chloroflexi bacterium]|nr:GIY-YIG nuclease family protein [Chloroflexota bacterium]